MNRDRESKICQTALIDSAQELYGSMWSLEKGDNVRRCVVLFMVVVLLETAMSAGLASTSQAKIAPGHPCYKYYQKKAKTKKQRIQLREKKRACLREHIRPGLPGQTQTHPSPVAGIAHLLDAKSHPLLASTVLTDITTPFQPLTLVYGFDMTDSTRRECLEAGDHRNDLMSDY